MQFHNYNSVRPREYSGSVDRFLDEALHGTAAVSLESSYDKLFGALLLEKAWRLVDRPYYNVFPVVESLCHKTTLEVPWEKVSFPFSPLLFRFPVGHEPYGVTSALVFTVPPPSVGGFDYGELPAFNRCWASDTDSVQSAVSACAKVSTDGMQKDARQACGYIMARSLACVVQFATPSGRQGFMWSVRSETWTETVEETLRGKTTGHVPDSIDVDGASVFIARLSVLAALVGQGDDLITPEILAKDESRYRSATPSEREWIESRAARINGRGFAFGKQLQEQSSCSPHWRNPHMALFWTGHKRSVPVLKLRSGCVVSSTPLSEIPTGFLSHEPDDCCAQDERPFVFRSPVSKRLRFRVMRRDGFRCQLCGLTQLDGVKLEVDHKIPVSKGGLSVEQNLWTLCHPCNNGKSDSDLQV